MGWKMDGMEEELDEMEMKCKSLQQWVCWYVVGN